VTCSPRLRDRLRATGSGPFGSGTAAAVLYRVVHGEPALAGLPPQLRQAVFACLAKDPRPAHAAALASMIANGMHASAVRRGLLARSVPT